MSLTDAASKTSWRLALRDALTPALMEHASVLAAWEGGSAAFGNEDELSDLDLQLRVVDGATEDVAEAILLWLEENLPVAARFTLPPPTWHGVWQTIYRFEAAPETFMLDLCIIEASQEWRFTDRERHGEPVVIFDRGGMPETTDLDAALQHEKIQAHLERTDAHFETLHPLVKKSIKRGSVGEAFWFYHRILLPEVISAARCLHCPECFDFGGRYLRRDLPQEVAEKLERLMMPGSLEELSDCYQQAVQLRAELRSQGP